MAQWRNRRRAAVRHGRGRGGVRGAEHHDHVECGLCGRRRWPAGGLDAGHEVSPSWQRRRRLGDWRPADAWARW